MKKLCKHLLMLAIVLCCIAGIAVNAQAAETVASGTCGYCLWTLDDEGTLTISGNGFMNSYNYPSDYPWWPYKSMIKEVVLCDGVTDIGIHAFRYYTNLSTVTISDSITSIHSYAFAGCSSLTSIAIPDSVTKIYGSAFEDCSNLTSVSLGNGITSISEYLFHGCSNLTHINISESVTQIEKLAFYNCSSLTTIVIPNSVNNIGAHAFKGCSSLTEITIPFIGESRGRTISFEYIFGDSDYDVPSTLRSVTVTSGEIPSCTFEGYRSLTSITIGDDVTSIGYRAFENCSGLTSVTIGNGVLNIDSCAFSGCCSLTSITIGDSVTNIGGLAFEDCSSLASIAIGNSVTSIGSYVFNNCKRLKTIIMHGDAPTIAYTAFSGVNATAYYPTNNTTWTEEVMQNYCGNINWQKSKILSIKIEPQIAYAIIGDTAKTTVKASGDGLIYQWYVKNAGASSYTKSSNKTATYSCKMSSKTDGRYVKCKIIDQYGNSVWTSTVRLKMKDLDITTQPVNRTVKDGITAKFTVKPNGSNVTYQWQYRISSGGSWKNASATGNKTATLSVPATVSRSGYQYRCRVTDSANDVIYSKAVNLYVLGVKTQPVSKTVVDGRTAKFTVAATGAGKTYQWQYRTSSAGSWKNAKATGNKTATLSVDATTAKHGYQYRCKITDSAGNTVYTNAVSLYVLGIKTQPASKTVKVGATAKFTVAATGKGLTYQWQYKTPSSGSWKNAAGTGSKTKTLSVPGTISRSGYQYRCKITDSAGNVIYTKTVKLTVK